MPAKFITIALCFFFGWAALVRAEPPKEKKEPLNPNVYLALVNGAAGALSSGAVAYEASHSWGATAAVAGLSAGINGGWQLYIDRALAWMKKPYSWDKHGFPSRSLKLAQATVVCTAAMGCVMHLTGLTDAGFWKESLRVLGTTGKYLLAAIPVYETINLFDRPNPSRTRRFLVNLIPFTMEVTLNAAMAAALIGWTRASDWAFFGILAAGGGTWLTYRFADVKAACVTGYRNLRGK